MKRTTLGLAGVLAVAAIIFASTGERVQLVEAADHIDSPAAVANGPADITDLYSWTWDDGGNDALAMILGAVPLAAADAAFAQNTHYVFNLDRGGTASQVICQFESDDNTAIRCWVGDAATNIIVVGDPTGATVLQQDGVKVFAGLRNDPFTFNQAGFNATTGAVHDAAVAGITLDEDGCPTDLDDPGLNPNPAAGMANADATILTLGGALRDCLASACDLGPGFQNANAVDLLDGQNVLSLVVSVPIAMIPGTGDVVSVYASTHMR